MSHKQYHVFVCDDCGEESDQEQGDFMEVWEGLKEEKWRCFKNGENWNHACPECSGRYNPKGGGKKKKPPEGSF